MIDDSVPYGGWRGGGGVIVGAWLREVDGDGWLKVSKRAGS